MNEPSKADYEFAIKLFTILVNSHKDKPGTSILIYENAMKAVEILTQEMNEKYG